ncbi:MAG: hypothetical protein KatS3mg095_0271 [Candidatus Parcubacteria bacterium]|nr:MAG: hypothetical protein KatS3mg095_0271 [Candidatus Parcubacteria bacterium]
MNFQIKCKNKLKKGYSLIEILIGLFFIAILTYAIIGLFSNLLITTLSSRINMQIMSVLENELEIIRVLNYEDIGIIDGWPRGKLPREKTINYNGLEIKVNYYIRNIDNPADGFLGGNPNDLAPADYKLVELEGLCLNCSVKTKKQTLTTIIAPKNVESSSLNGSLFIKVINASGEPVPQANVLVINNATSPPIIIQDLTNQQGLLQLIDIPTGTNVYQITVSKENYSTDKTYQPGLEENPNPIIPHQTVLEQSLTSVTLQIDLLANLLIKTINNFCQPVPNVSLKLTGQKLIGANPDIIKNIISTTTDSNGEKTLKLEWDNYNYELTNPSNIIEGYNSSSPLNILPGLNYFLRLNIASSINNSLLITAIDENNNPIDEVEVNLSRIGFTQTKYTKTENINHNNWINNYSNISQNISINEDGSVSLKNIGGTYPTNTLEWLISKTIDIGTSTNVRFLELKWSPINQPPDTEVKFQIAVNNDNSNWEFIGPDGTSNSYFTITPANLINIPNNKRYLRYKIYMKTNNENYTPVINNLGIRFSSNCLSPGQVIFSNLISGIYNIELNKEGYQTIATTTEINTTFKELKFILFRQ